MLVVQDQVWNRVTINRAAHKSTRYYIDEMHLLFQFLGFGGHNAVKLGILREVIHERQDCRAIKQQALALTGVGHIR